MNLADLKIGRPMTREGALTGYCGRVVNATGSIGGLVEHRS